MSEQDESKVPRIARWTFGCGHILNDLTASCWFSYLLVFLRTVLLFPSTSAGALLLIGQVADGIATPLVGLLSDKTEHAFGKRRLWILVGSLCVMITFPFIFHSIIIEWFTATNNLRVLYYAFFISLFQFAWAAVQVNHMALVPELSDVPGDRVFLNSVRSVATILANVAVFILAGVLLSQGPDSLGPADAGSFFTLALICITVGFVCLVVFISGVSEPPVREKPAGSQVMEWHHWFRERSFYETAIVYTCTRICTNVTQVFLPLYLVLSLNAPKGFVATIPFAIFASSFLSTMTCERMTRFMGSEKLMIFGSSIVVASSFGWFSLLPEDCHWAYVFAICSGLGIGFTGVASLSLICDLIGDRCESSAFVYGSMSLCDKLSNGIVIMLVESFVREGDSVGSYYRDVQVFVPGLSAIIACLVLSFVLMTRPSRQLLESPCARLTRMGSASGVMTGLSGVSAVYERPTISEATPLLSKV